MRNFNKPTSSTYTVREATELLPFILHVMQGISHSRAKAILSGGGVKVNRRNVTRHDYALKPGMVVEIAKRKPRNELKSPFVKIVYEDAAIIVVEKAVGILSMATSPAIFCVKQVLDDYFRKSRQRCTWCIVWTATPRACWSMRRPWKRSRFWNTTGARLSPTDATLPSPRESWNRRRGRCRVT